MVDFPITAAVETASENYARRATRNRWFRLMNDPGLPAIFKAVRRITQ